MLVAPSNENALAWSAGTFVRLDLHCGVTRWRGSLGRFTVARVATGANHVSKLNSLMARGADSGCVGELEIEALSVPLELDDGEIEQLRERLAAAGVEVRDDEPCNGDLAQYTVDAMGQFRADARVTRF
jgi:hypothetical protein